MFTRRRLVDYLAANGIDQVTVEHAAVFRVGDDAAVAALPGAHTKNLFLEDSRGRLWLVSAQARAVVDLKRLPAAIGSGRLSFGSAALMAETLGVAPGSVTPFALVNDAARRVRLVLDRDLASAAWVNFHPLVNTATTRITGEGLRRFLDAVGVTPLIVDFGALPDAARATI